MQVECFISAKPRSVAGQTIPDLEGHKQLSLFGETDAFHFQNDRSCLASSDQQQAPLDQNHFSVLVTKPLMFWPRAIQQSPCVGWDRHSSYTYLTVFCSLRICPLWSSEADRSKWNLILWSLSNASWSEKKTSKKTNTERNIRKSFFYIS